MIIILTGEKKSSSHTRLLSVERLLLLPIVTGMHVLVTLETGYLKSFFDSYPYALQSSYVRKNCQQDKHISQVSRIEISEQYADEHNNHPFRPLQQAAAYLPVQLFLGCGLDISHCHRAEKVQGCPEIRRQVEWRKRNQQDNKRDYTFNVPV